MSGKQKSQASAAFLGVLIVPKKCCQRVLHSHNNLDGTRVRKATSKASKQTPSRQPVAKPANQTPRKNAGFSQFREAATEKAAAVDAAAFRKIDFDRRRAS